MTNNEANRKQASKLYHLKMQAIGRLLERVDAALNADAMRMTINGGKTTIDYGHVGDLSAVEATLTELLARIERTGEYA